MGPVLTDMVRCIAFYNLDAKNIRLIALKTLAFILVVAR